MFSITKRPKESSGGCFEGTSEGVPTVERRRVTCWGFASDEERGREEVVCNETSDKKRVALDETTMEGDMK